MLWNKLAFGTFTPVSGQIKQWWSTFSTNIYGSPALSFQSFFAVTPNAGFDAWEPALSIIDTWNKSITGFLPSTFSASGWTNSASLFFSLFLGALAYLLLFLAKKQKARAILQIGRDSPFCRTAGFKSFPITAPDMFLRRNGTG